MHLVSDPTTADPDRTTRARIRDAAVAAFGERGVQGTSLKVIAAAAGVSQALIVHHFGTKNALRQACDEYVALTIRTNKLAALGQGQPFDPLAALRRGTVHPSLLRYLARTAGDGTPEVAALFDELVDDAVEYMAQGERAGTILPTEWPRERAAVLVLWSLGLLTLHEHAERLLGIDLLHGEPEQFGPYVLPTLEMLSRGVLAEGLYEQMREALGRANDEEGDDD